MEITDPRELLKAIAQIFEKLEIPYLVTGGMAVLVWGRPRFTADIDIVIEIKHSNIKNLVAALKSLSQAGYIDEDVANEIVEQGGEFNFIDGNTGIKVDFWIFDKSNFDTERFKRRTTKEILGEKIYFTSPEDLILSKLKWFKASNSNRHLEDAESVIKISGENLDIDYLRSWSEKLGFSDQFEKLITDS